MDFVETHQELVSYVIGLYCVVNDLCLASHTILCPLTVQKCFELVVCNDRIRACLLHLYTQMYICSIVH
jgi:hypothetical protein